MTGDFFVEEKPKIEYYEAILKLYEEKNKGKTITDVLQEFKNVDFLTEKKQKSEFREKISKLYEEKSEGNYIKDVLKEFTKMLEDYKLLARTMSLEFQWRLSLENLILKNYENITKYFQQQKKGELMLYNYIKCPGDYTQNPPKRELIIAREVFEEQDKELNNQETQITPQETKPKYEIKNTHSIQILEQQKPEYEINNIDNINITDIIAEKKCTEDKEIQTDKTENVQAEEKRVPIKIKGKQKKVVQKPKKKLNLCYLEFNHKENENLYSKQKVDDNKDLVKMQFERLGDKGWRNPSNLMLSVGKSPYRDDDKHYIGGKWN